MAEEAQTNHTDNQNHPPTAEVVDNQNHPPMVAEEEEEAKENSNNVPLPYLFVAETFAGSDCEEEEEEDDQCKFYHFSGGVSKAKLPELHKKKCLSSHGWLFTLTKDGVHAKLLNPLTRRQIDLPSLDTLVRDRKYKKSVTRCVNKFDLSSDPETTKEEELLVVIIWGGYGYLGFCRPGDDKWTVVSDGWISCSEDMVYHNGLVYIYDGCYNIMSCNVHDQNPVLSKVSNLWFSDDRQPRFPNEQRPDNVCDYVVGMGDKLLIVCHDTEYEEGDDDDDDEKLYLTRRFRVFAFDFKTGDWSRMDDLGDMALFVGQNASFSVVASDVIKANCIYFTDDVMVMNPGDGSKDMGIYHMSHGTIEPHFDVVSYNTDSPPLWVRPID